MSVKIGMNTGFGEYILSQQKIVKEIPVKKHRGIYSKIAYLTTLFIVTLNLSIIYERLLIRSR